MLRYLVLIVGMVGPTLDAQVCTVDPMSQVTVHGTRKTFMPTSQFEIELINTARAALIRQELGTTIQDDFQLLKEGTNTSVRTISRQDIHQHDIGTVTDECYRITYTDRKTATLTLSGTVQPTLRGMRKPVDPLINRSYAITREEWIASLPIFLIYIISLVI